MKISKSGIDLIKKYEGCRLVAYKPVPTEKYWTIGWGHYGKDVEPDAKITQEEADKLFLKDIQKYVNGVNEAVKVEINQNQFDSLVSFAYNCGVGALQKSTLLEYINAKDFDSAAKEFDKWTKGGGKILPGLVKRRNEEEALFRKAIPVPKEKPKPAPKPKMKKVYTSVVDWLVDHNQPHDFVSRHNLAKKHGIMGYNGSADQNIALLKILQK